MCAARCDACDDEPLTALQKYCIMNNVLRLTAPCNGLEHRVMCCHGSSQASLLCSSCISDVETYTARGNIDLADCVCARARVSIFRHAITLLCVHYSGRCPVLESSISRPTESAQFTCVYVCRHEVYVKLVTLLFDESSNDPVCQYSTGGKFPQPRVSKEVLRMRR